MQTHVSRIGILRLAESYLCAGSSALLLYVAQRHPEFWYVSLFALVPFLWRAVRVKVGESILLAGLLTLAYCFVTMPPELPVISRAFFAQLISLGTALALFGVLVNRVSKHLGPNAVIIAVLWLPLDYALSQFGHLNSILTPVLPDSGFVVRFGSLFGMLVASSVVVLINVLLLHLLERVIQSLRARPSVKSKSPRKYSPSFNYILPRKRLLLTPHRRGPPSV